MMIVIDLVAIMMFLVLLVPSKVMLVINFIALVTIWCVAVPAVSGHMWGGMMGI